MFFTKISVFRPVLMTMFIMSFVVLGGFSFTELAIDLFPNVEFPIVSVRTIYPGAGPEEMENLITRHIEEEVSAISGVKNITSTSVEGLSMVAIEFELGTEVDVAAADVKDKIELVKAKIPLDAEDPVVLKFDFGAAAAVDLAISSTRPLNEVFDITDDIIKPELLKIDGLASVNIVGGKEREIRVQFDTQLLRSQNLHINDIIASLQSENLNLPSGHITEQRKEFSIRVSGEFSEVNEIEDLIILAGDEKSVRLRDVATVFDDFKEQRKSARYNNETSVGVSLIKRSDANIVEVADEVLASIGRLQALVPPDVRINVASDNSLFIRNSITEVMNNMGIGIILTSIILYLFLHSWQGTVIASVAMPTSIIATFILIRFAGFTLNFMTLLGLAVTVGVLVTNSIVVLENIVRYTGIERDVKQASIKGTTEIATAVGASTLTNIVVFTPMAFMGGIVGQFFFSFGLTVAFATLFSFIVSLTLTPMLASILLAKKEGKSYGFDLFAVSIFVLTASIAIIGAFISLANTFLSGQGTIALFSSIVVGLGFALFLARKTFAIPMEVLKKNIFYKIWNILIKTIVLALVAWLVFFVIQYLFNTTIAVSALVFLAIIFIMDKSFGFLAKFAAGWDKFYDNLALDYKKSLDWALGHKITVIMVTVSFLFVSLYLAQYVGSEFFTEGDQGYIAVSIELPPGSNYEQTDKTLLKIEKVLGEVPEILSYYTVLGQSSGTMVGNNEGVQFGEITVRLVAASERTRRTSDVLEELKLSLSAIPTADILLAETSAGGDDGGSPLVIEITGDDLDRMNVIAERVVNIAKDTPGAVNIKSSWKEGVPEYRLIPDRKKMADYGISLFSLANGIRSSIEGNVATKYRVGNKEYDVRVQLSDYYTEYADQIKDITVKVKDNYLPVTELASIQFTEGPISISRKNKKRLISVTGDFVNRAGGDVVNDIKAETDLLELPAGYEIFFGGDADTQAESFAELIKTLLLAIILSFMVLAAIMESFIHPFTVMVTLPLALIGVIISLLITGKTLNIISMMAIVMLVGIVVNNAILIIDYIQILRNKGKQLREAILEACSVRLRPIIMTNLATAISMLPLALGLGEGAEFRAPMAIVSIGALITSTTFTLYLIPIIYNVFESIKGKAAVKTA